MGEVAGEPLKKQIAKFDATCAIAENQWKITYNCHLWLDDGQASSFRCLGPLEIPFRQLITKIWMTIEHMHEINVERVGQLVCQLRFETLYHIETNLAIERLRCCLFLQLGKAQLQDL